MIKSYNYIIEINNKTSNQEKYQNILKEETQLIMNDCQQICDQTQIQFATCRQPKFEQNVNKNKIKFKDKVKNVECITKTDGAQKDQYLTLQNNNQSKQNPQTRKLTLKPISTSNTPPTSPQHSPTHKYYRTNHLRNTNNQTKQQISLLQARINKLRQENQLNKRRTLRSYRQIDKIINVRSNMIEKEKGKSVFLEKRRAELVEVSERVRIQRIVNREVLEGSKEKMIRMKNQQAKNIKLQVKKQQQNIRLQKIKNVQLNKQLANRIKAYEAQHNNTLLQFRKNSRIKARSNHDRKVQQYLKEQQILEKTKKSLKKYQYKLLEQLQKEWKFLQEIEDKKQKIKHSKATIQE